MKLLAFKKLNKHHDCHTYIDTNVRRSRMVAALSALRRWAWRGVSYFHCVENVWQMSAPAANLTLPWAYLKSKPKKRRRHDKILWLIGAGKISFTA
jgi:hypothetical protein